ncbi:MAG: hypothetical protein L6R41_007395 [Letrouitia leprolyta]|nr:MAG: hypothetical protein L6R41_007395 [Letrouitia leprolyta]
MSTILDQLKSIKDQLARSDKAAANLDADGRREAASLAHAIMFEVEDPGNLVDRIIYQAHTNTHTPRKKQPAENALVLVAVETGIFKFLNESPEPLNAETLAKNTNVEVTLLERILRGLAAMDAVEEIGEDGYAPTNLSRAFTTVKGDSTTNYRNPTDPDHTALNIAFNTKDHYFDIMARDPEILRHFGLFMASQAVGRPNFLDFYPAKEQIIDGYESDLNTSGVIFVDVGGARGEEALELRRRHPSHPGRLILQERADVLEHVPATDGLEMQVHDFLTPQPVRGARVYYFRRILHNWNDELALKILQNTVTAMARGYSKIIINDIVMPRRGASSLATNLDLLMMSFFSAMQRTEQQWRDLLRAAGLKIVKVWTARGTDENIIEAMLE